MHYLKVQTKTKRKNGAPCPGKRLPMYSSVAFEERKVNVTASSIQQERRKGKERGEKGSLQRVMGLQE